MTYGTTSSLAVARRGAGIAGAIALAIGAFWLAAWLLGFAANWSAHFITVKTNMALGQVLAGTALLLLAGGAAPAWRRRLAIAAGAVVLLIGVATLSEHLVGWNLGIDQLLAPEPPGAVATASPNRIGLPGSTSLALLGAGLLALAWGRRTWAAPYLGLTVCLIVLVPLVGFLYGIHEFYGKGALTGIAWPSTVALLMLGIGLMLARPEAGPVSLLLRDDAGGMLLRRMLPVAVLVPLVLGFLRMAGQHHGLYTTATGTGLLVISLVLIFSAMLWRSATHLSRSAATQRQAEAEIRSMAQFPEDNPNPVLRAADDGTVLYANRLARELVQTMGGDSGRILPQPLLDASRHILNGTSKDAVECEVIDPRGRVWSFVLAPSPRDRHVNLYGRDVTERKRGEREREIAIEFLSLVNRANDLRSLVEAAVRFFREQSGCEAVGIRLRQGDDYPYYEVQGFSEEFVRLENSLCVRDPDGQVQRDAAGNPVMACMCGNVICGRFDPGKSFFTPTGSFWANDTTRLLATTTDADRQTPTRNRCNGEGYESVALIGLRYGQERMGLLQLNDRRKGMFSPETIALWERLAGYLAVALANVRAEEALRESERLQRLLARLGELAAHLTTDAELIEAIGGDVAGELGVSRCGFSHVDVEAGQITVTNDFHGQLPSLAGVFPMAGYADYYMEDGLAGRTVMLADAATDPRTAGAYESAYAPIHVRAHLTVPLLRNGRWVANFWVSHHEPRPWTAAEAELMRATADRVWAIIERKRVEAAISRSQKTFSELVELAPFGIYVVDSQFRIAHMNASSQTGAFRNVRPVIGRDFAEAMRVLWPEPVAAEIIAVFRHTLETGEPYYSPPFVNPRHDVEIVESYEWELHRMTLPDGQYGVICYYFDSTKLRQAQASLQRSESLLKADLSALTRMHVLSGRVLKAEGLQPLLQEVMDAAVAIMDARKGTLQLLEGDSLRIVAHHGHDQPFLEFFASAESRASVCGEATKRGERVVVPDVEKSELFAGTPSLAILRQAGVRAVQSTPLLSRNGTLLGILTTQWDTPYSPDEHGLWRIDLLVRQAADLIEYAQAEQAIRRSEEHFRALVTATSDVVYRMSPDWREMRQLHGQGFLADTEASDSAWLERYIPLEDQSQVTATIQQAIRAKSIFELEHRVLRADGSIGWTFSRAIPMLDASGQIVEWFGAASDISKRKQAEQQLRDLTQTLEKRVAERTAVAEERAGQLRLLAEQLTQAEQHERKRIAHILHEHFQQLLAAAKFHLGMLCPGISGDELQDSVRQTSDVLDQAIQASRSLSVELSPPILHYAGLAKALAWLSEWMQDKYRLEVEVAADEQLDALNENARVLLFQAVRELLFNTVKHAGVKRARVEMKLNGDGNLSLTVSDEGAGFDPSRVAAERRLTGGFGLFSIQERLGFLGGQMQVRSAAGQGTCITMLLPLGPLVQAEVAERPSLVHSPSVESGSTDDAAAKGPANRKTRVLIADDHAVVRDGIVRLLQMQADVQVVGEAADGRQAVDLALRERPDVVIMDVSMPGMSGIEATRQILADLPNTRIIGLSMHQEEDVARQMRQAGAVAYLAKTGSTDQIVTAIRTCTRANG